MLSQLQLIVGQFIWIGDENEPFPIEIGPHFEEEKSLLKTYQELKPRDGTDENEVIKNDALTFLVDV